MTLSLLRLQNVRCLATVELALHEGVNLFVGANGAGKTSLLEAVYLLGRGRSFRTRLTEQLIRHGSAELWVAGQLATDPLSRLEHRCDIRCRRAGGVQARIDGEAVPSLAALAEVFPVQVIDPGIHRLLEEGPGRRRRWLDWIVFHVEPGFVGNWRDYGRALHQRMAALACGEDPGPWEAEMARQGDVIDAARCRVMNALLPLWPGVLKALQAIPATIGYERGWAQTEPLAAALARHRERDRSLKRARYGPHRFDVRIQLEGRAAREIVSRGQQKLLGAGLTLLAVHYVTQATGRRPTLLLDDPAAELDRSHAEALLQAIEGLGGQRLVTALSVQALPGVAADAVFHVERGGVEKTV